MYYKLLTMIELLVIRMKNLAKASLFHGEQCY